MARRKQAKIFTASRGVLYAEGATKAEAKANLDAKIDAALSRDLSYEPVVIRDKSGTMVGLVWRDPQTFMSCLTGSSCQIAHSSRYTRDDVCRALRANAAQNRFDASVPLTVDDTVTEAKRIADDLFLFDADVTERAGGSYRDARSEFIRWCVWQFGYRQARAAQSDGVTDHEALREGAEATVRAWCGIGC